jgi:hypothetical protein
MIRHLLLHSSHFSLHIVIAVNKAGEGVASNTVAAVV